VGEVIQGIPQVGEMAIAAVDSLRRSDIMRNHTATHLLHAALRSVLGEHARQAGSLVAPDRLRFDFTHPEALSAEHLARIEAGINRDILGNYALKITYKPLQQAINEGAMALFGEKYASTVRTITIGDDDPFSYELCGGTHVEETSAIGICLITNEGSVAAGIRRIEAVTGRAAYELVQRRFDLLNRTSELLSSSVEYLPDKVIALQDELSATKKQLALLRQNLVSVEFDRLMEQAEDTGEIKISTAIFNDTEIDVLRQQLDRYRQRFPQKSIGVIASINQGRPILIASITEDLVQRGLHAGELVKYLSAPLGGSGGGKPTLAQAGGKDPDRLKEALAGVRGWVESHLTN